MNFDYTDEQQALRDLAHQIIGDKIDHATLKSLEASGERIHHETWQALAEAGVLGALLPESAGGAGVGMVGVGAVLEVVGEHAAPVPVFASMVLGALPIAEFGTDTQRAMLDGVVAGTTVLSAALAASTVTATAGDAGHVLTGTASFVPSGLDADYVLVPAGDGVFVVPTDADGLTVESMAVTTGYPEARLVFDDVVLDSDALLGGSAARAAQVAWMASRADAAICAVTTGLSAGALELMSTYANERKQFDRVIASFQAVSQRAGDSYIDLEALRLTARSAAFQLDHGADATRELAIARFWAAESGHRIVHAATHVHGGVGVDRDYPLHRHFLMSRQLELTLGNAETNLETLGTLLAG